ncbi:MAG TPA: XisI protein [Chthonomonadaceae bacterium]|nr:XisI protein [Chthonomonadaceae bacterium]
MDKVAHYQEIIREILMPLTERRYSGMNVTNEAVFDEANRRYLIMSVGWEGNVRRIHHCLVHLDIINDKVWIQRDGTEDGIGYELEAAGIPKSDIVPAFHPEDVRPYTGYGVA